MTEPSGDALDRAIIDASRELSAAIRARPRDQQRIDNARAEVERLQAIKDAADATA